MFQFKNVVQAKKNLEEKKELLKEFAELHENLPKACGMGVGWISTFSGKEFQPD